MTQTRDNGWQQAILQNPRATAQLELKVDILNNKVDNIENRVSQLTDKVDKIENRVSQLTDKVDKIENRFSQLTTDVQEIKEQLKGFLFVKVGVVTIALALVARLIGDFLLVH